MIRRTFKMDGTFIDEEAEPLCVGITGVKDGDFCDSCGVCLACQSECECLDGTTSHAWVVYE